MRAKHVWTYVPLPAYTKLFWERITFSRLTTVYLAFSFIHFLIQLALQIKVFTINAAAFDAATSMIGNVETKGLPFYQDSILRICEWVPSSLNFNDGSCKIIWPRDSSSSQQDNVSSISSIVPSTVRLEQTATQGPSSEILRQPQLSLSFSAPTSTTVVAGIAAPIVASGSTVPTALVGNLGQQASVLSSSRIPALPATTPRVPIAATASGTPAAVTILRAPPIVTAPRVPTVATTPRAPATVTVVVIPPASSSLASPAVSSLVPTALNNAGTTVSESLNDSGDKVDEDGVDDDDNNGIVHIFSGRDDLSDTQALGIPPVCQEALIYPLSILGNTKREDIVFMAFQFWVFGMSVVALLNESIPHIIASLLTHIMATAWGGFQLIHTANFRSEFNTLITRGACQNIQPPFASSYWEARKAAEVPSLALNILALLISCFLTWRLIKLFGWQTFKRVGASLIINRMYKLVLILSITIQLSLFFMAITVSLWLDRLINNLIGDLADLRRVYIATSAITLILLIPWLMLGWFGVRRELKAPMLMFLGMCILYLGGWGMMFVSTTFRWTFITWRFFSVMAAASVLLTVASLILGILCRMNFGRGLLRYLSAQEALPGDNFGIVTPEHDTEKVDFPSTEKPMPTFDAAYGSQAPAGGRMFISNGPRFFNHSPSMGVVIPSQALVRTPSDRSAHSHCSEKTTSSWDSYYTYSHSRNNSFQHGQPKRWVIE